MYTLNVLMFILLFLSFVVYVLANFLGKKMKKEREKNSPFECGFDPFKKARTSFSIRFFLVAIIFLIFDIEIVVLMPVGILMNYSMIGHFSLISSLIIVVLIIGLVHEWNQGALNWVT
uniref:NADH-ubiquinone oxidoreductase chain 3 n=1 Tax=Metacrangonyx dominicanus TaxID=1199168 RepID=K7ZVW8_9CRUS|nr:NADH dehydrogenase subunit 3 [Metacrangonyx dominicanus]CCI69361.1 NADH dehydrogenase subunit 3 [Metacrangonyx dominicanus]